MNRFKKYLHVASWVPLLLLRLGIVLLGLVAVPIALSCKQWPRVLWVWGNAEEEVPVWWLKKSKGHWFTKMFPNFYWYAIRNPSNNLRYLFKDREAQIETNWHYDEPMEARNMRNHNVAMAYRWAWSGPFAGFRQVWIKSETEYGEMWFGWKVGSNVPGLGFTSQLRLSATIGN